MKKESGKKTKSKEIPDDLKKLGDRLRQLRLRSHSSHEIFAYENKIGRVQYGRYERGASDIQYTTLLRIIKAFDMTIEEFFSEGFD